MKDRRNVITQDPNGKDIRIGYMLKSEDGVQAIAYDARGDEVDLGLCRDTAEADNKVFLHWFSM